MNGLGFCIRRPVFATVLNVLVVVFGLVALSQLSIREYPAIDKPVISVVTTYSGASAEVIEQTVTRPIEDALAVVDGLDLLTSTSRDGKSEVKLEFSESRDIDSAAADVRDLVSRVSATLAEGADDPIASKARADAQPIIYLAFSSNRHSTAEIDDFLRRNIVDTLQNLDGVASAEIIGGRSYAMQVRIDPLAMAAHGVTAADIEEALEAEAVELPAGKVRAPGRSFTVRTEAPLSSAAAFARVPILKHGSVPVRISDIGEVSFEPVDDTTIARINGNPGVLVGLVRQGTANPLDISRDLEEALPDIERRLPAGMTVAVPYDSTVFISKSIDNVVHTIGEAAVLVIAVIFLFLGSLRATIVPLVAIPVSIIGVFGALLVLGFSINSLTLLAVVLAIGLVVDDAIVVLENIERHVRNGLPPIQAAERSVREIGFAVVAMTITLAAVFLPVSFMEGEVGALLGEFALTLAGAVIISGFVALTLSPMLSSRLLSARHSTGRFSRAIDRTFGAIENGYRAALGLAMRARLAVLLISLAVVGAGGYVAANIGEELAPLEDRAYFFGIAIGPQGASLDYTDTYVREIEQIYAGVPEIDYYVAIVGMPDETRGITVAVLKDWEARERSQFEIVSSLAGPLFGNPGLIAVPVNPPSLSAGGTEKPVQIVIRDTRSWAEIAETGQAAVARLRDSGLVKDVSANLTLSRPSFVVRIDRQRAADLGVDVTTIASAVESLVAGRKVSDFEHQGRKYPVNLRVPDNALHSTDVLDQISVRSSTGELVSLSSVLDVQEEVGPPELSRFERNRSVTISANLAPGTTLGEVLTQAPAALAEVLPPTASIDFDGPSRSFKDSGSSILLTGALALLVIYLVLAAQFESFTDPIIILTAVPLTVAGALFTLELADAPLSLYGQIGLITLVGLIAKHGIMITEFANQLQEAGRTKHEAIVEAAVLRLRPILMTAGSMVLGAVPLAIATGAGAVSRTHIGLTIVGGLTFGTLMTVFVVPVAYSVIARRRAAAAAPDVATDTP